VALVALEIPKIGLVMENARLVRWLKNVGDIVQQGEPLLELETEKSIVEVESTETGRLVELLMQADQEAHVGDRIAWLENASKNGAAPKPVPSPVRADAAPASARSDQAGAVPPAGSTDARVSPSHPAPHGKPLRARSSPVARRLAAENDLDLNRIAGTGPRGRIQLSDVRRAVSASAGGAAPAPPARQPLSTMRRALARAMTLSNATVPQFTVERAVDWTVLQAHRTTLLAALAPASPRPSVNDFLLQAIANALLAFPSLNATFSGDADSADAALQPARGAHVGLVVAVPDGVLVPVIHDVERHSIAELARRRSDIVERAQRGKLKREELEGATFSLSNLGAAGPDRFSAMINPPQSAILAVGRQRDCVVVLDGGIQVRPLSQLTLTVDHRVADGRLASDFLGALVTMIEGGSWRLN
jgi:pyruvate dehydrogenase E2 component (dihydrolipoamide acetyltransferase)